MKYYQNEEGFVFKSECILCEKFASYNLKTNQCECRELYVRANGVCVPRDAACDKVTQVFNERTKKCECVNGYTEKNGVCTANTICPQGFSLFKGNCYRIMRNLDTPATSSSSASSLTTGSPSTATTSSNQNQSSATKQACQLPFVWNEITKSCQCPGNTNLDDVNKSCVGCK
jgi:hypothetical protein